LALLALEWVVELLKAALSQCLDLLVMCRWEGDFSFSSRYTPVTGVSGPNVGDMFIWMPKEHLYVLVYLVTVMHSMQAGYMDKAQKYTDKALMQIEKLKSAYLDSGWHNDVTVSSLDYIDLNARMISE
jgi:hypothetical protein